jgi:hypothetical protein
LVLSHYFFFIWPYMGVLGFPMFCYFAVLFVMFLVLWCVRVDV